MGRVTRFCSCLKITPRVIAGPVKPNLFTDPSFDNPGAWDIPVPVYWSVTGGEAVCSGGGIGVIRESIPALVPGGTYQAGFVISDVGTLPAPAFSMFVGENCSIEVFHPLQVGEVSAIITAGSADTWCGLSSTTCSGGLFNGKISDIFLREYTLPYVPAPPVYLTDFDRDLVIGGDTYISTHGFTPTQLQIANDLSVGNADLEGLLDLAGVSRDRILAKAYNSAELEWFLYDYEAEVVKRTLIKGTWGQVSSTRNDYKAEMRTLSQQLRQSVLEQASPLCRVEIGSPRCGVDLGPYTVTGTVDSVSVSEPKRVFVDNGRTEADDWFVKGVMTWKAGSANAGVSAKVKIYRDVSGDKTFEFFDPVPNPIQPNDEYDVYAGCDQRHTTCIDKFDNMINFQGEEDMPLDDKVNSFGGQTPPEEDDPFAGVLT